MQTILVAADFSGCSEDAFQLARSLARDYGARLVVVHIATPPPLVTPGELEKALQRPDGYRADLERRLRSVYAADTSEHIEYRVGAGDPAAEILHLAVELRSDLLVMGTHGRTGVGRLLMGSVAEKVVRQASCPVVTLRASADHLSSPSPGVSPRRATHAS